MKKVFSNKTDVARLWANQSQDEATTSGRGSFYFEGKIIYSYGSHFPIAKIEDGKNCLFTLRGYSNTTSKHISEAFCAARNANLNVIYCWDIHDIDGSLIHWRELLQSKVDELRNKRNWDIAGRLHTIAYNVAQLEAYCDYMKIRLSELDFEFSVLVAFCKGENIVEKLRSIIFHPVVSDPTNFKGMPYVDAVSGEVHLAI